MLLAITARTPPGPVQSDLAVSLAWSSCSSSMASSSTLSRTTILCYSDKMVMSMMQKEGKKGEAAGRLEAAVMCGRSLPSRPGSRDASISRAAKDGHALL